MVFGIIGTGIVLIRCGGRGPEMLVPVSVDGCLANIDGPGLEIAGRLEIDPDIGGAMGRGTYSYVGGAGACGISLERGRVAALGTGGGRSVRVVVYGGDTCVLVGPDARNPRG